MTKPQHAVLLCVLVLFLGLYFGFDTKPKERQSVEQGRAVMGESTGGETILAAAIQRLSPAQAEVVSSLEKQLATASDAGKTAIMKSLSGKWYGLGEIPVAGLYAQQAAELENMDSTWSVAGATFFEALVKSEDAKIRDFCTGRAIKAFESAASLQPANVQHRVNLALVYAENPPPDKPMTAALMLRDLADKHPKDPAPFNALGRLSIKTGQWQNAVKRLEQSWSLDKTNPNTPCLLAKAYEGAGDAAKASAFAKLCK